MEDPILIKELFIGQRDLNRKMDALHQYVAEHMDEENENIASLHVAIARLEEKAKSNSKNWGMVATVITSLVVAACTQLVTKAI